jgi:hypothetical protein
MSCSYLTRGRVTEFFVEPVVVVEADPLQCLVLEPLEAQEAPGDQLGLVGRDPGFGHRVVVHVATTGD